MYGRNRKDGEKVLRAAYLTNPSRMTPHQYIFVDGADFDFFVRFENTASCMLDDMLAQANSVCLPALSRSDRRVLVSLLVARVDCAVLYRAVITVLVVRGW